MGRVVVGIGGTALSKHALRWTASEAKRTGAFVQPVMVWEHPYHDMWIPNVESRGDPLVFTRRALERIVKGVLGQPPDVAVEPSAVVGSAQMLVEAAKGADLLVAGNRGQGGRFAGILLGSVSFHCVSHAPCPVVVVRGKANSS
jgi:nucleotide-binding universal stress UspA family protein